MAIASLAATRSTRFLSIEDGKQRWGSTGITKGKGRQLDKESREISESRTGEVSKLTTGSSRFSPTDKVIVSVWNPTLYLWDWEFKSNIWSEGVLTVEFRSGLETSMERFRSHISSLFSLGKLGNLGDWLASIWIVRFDSISEESDLVVMKDIWTILVIAFLNGSFAYILQVLGEEETQLLLLLFVNCLRVGSFSLFGAGIWCKKQASIMTQGQWVKKSGDRRQVVLPERTRIKISRFDNSSVIKGFERTTIGRCMNPDKQPTGDAIFHLPRIWKLSGKIQGTNLGLGSFQFTFDKEEDIEDVLKMEPLHFNSWMLAIARWEPSREVEYPSKIRFWIRVLGVPLQFWAAPTFQDIGDAIGFCDKVEVATGRIRVTIDGLKPLVFEPELEFEGVMEVAVQLQYEKLLGFCTRCFSLCHAADMCGVGTERGESSARPSSREERGSYNQSYKHALTNGGSTAEDSQRKHRTDHYSQRSNRGKEKVTRDADYRPRERVERERREPRDRSQNQNQEALRPFMGDARGVRHCEPEATPRRTSPGLVIDQQGSNHSDQKFRAFTETLSKSAGKIPVKGSEVIVETGTLQGSKDVANGDVIMTEAGSSASSGMEGSVPKLDVTKTVEDYAREYAEFMAARKEKHQVSTVDTSGVRKEGEKPKSREDNSEKQLAGHRQPAVTVVEEEEQKGGGKKGQKVPQLANGAGASKKLATVMRMASPRRQQPQKTGTKPGGTQEEMPGRKIKKQPSDEDKPK